MCSSKLKPILKNSDLNLVFENHIKPEIPHKSKFYKNHSHQQKLRILEENHVIKKNESSKNIKKDEQTILREKMSAMSFAKFEKSKVRNEIDSEIQLSRFNKNQIDDQEETKTFNKYALKIKLNESSITSHNCEDRTPDEIIGSLQMKKLKSNIFPFSYDDMSKDEEESVH